MVTYATLCNYHLRKRCMQIGGLPSTKPRSIFRNSAIPKSIGNPCASDLGLKICAGAPTVGFVEWSVCFWIQVFSLGPGIFKVFIKNWRILASSLLNFHLTFHRRLKSHSVGLRRWYLHAATRRYRHTLAGKFETLLEATLGRPHWAGVDTLLYRKCCKKAARWLLWSLPSQ